MPENQDIGNWRGSGIDWFENIVAIRKEKRYRTESRWRTLAQRPDQERAHTPKNLGHEV